MIKIAGKIAGAAGENIAKAQKNVERRILTRAEGLQADCFECEKPVKTDDIPLWKPQRWLFKSIVGERPLPKYKNDFVEKLLGQTDAKGQPRFTPTAVKSWARLGEDDFRKASRFAAATNPDDSFRFNEKEISTLIGLSTKRCSRIEKLLALQGVDFKDLVALSAHHIDSKKADSLISAQKEFENNLYFNPEGLQSLLTSDSGEFEQMMPKIRAKFAMEKDNLAEFTFGKFTVHSKNYMISYKFKNGGNEEILFDRAGKKLNYSKVEVRKNKFGEDLYVKKQHDARNKTYSIIHYIKDDGEFVPIKEKRIIQDKTRKIIKTDIIKKSKVRGIFSEKTVDADGNVKILSSGKRGKNGGFTVKKDMESLDGTKTQYEYHEDQKGNRVSGYKITDKNGKVLLDDSSSFKIIDENTVISTHKGKSYEIKTDFFAMHVRDLKTGEINDIKYSKIITGDGFDLKELLSKVDAEELIALSKKGVKLRFIDDPMESKLRKDGIIEVGKNVFVLEHEATHAKDARYFNETDFNKDRLISTNPDLLKVYNKERTAFMDAFPLAQQKHIDYFINKLTHKGGKNGSIKETVAESGAMLRTYQSMQQLAMRTNYLQQYFPRTIAKVAEILESIG